MKKCSRCKELKDSSQFNLNKAMRDGLSNQCRPCLHLWKEKPESAKNRKLIYRHGITLRAIQHDETPAG